MPCTLKMGTLHFKYFEARFWSCLAHHCFVIFVAKIVTAIPVKRPPRKIMEAANRSATRLIQLESTNEEQDKPKGANTIPGNDFILSVFYHDFMLKIFSNGKN